MQFIKHRTFFYLQVLVAILLINLSAQSQNKSSVYIRFKVTEPVSQNLQVTISGYRHLHPNWYFPRIQKKLGSDTWSEWIDLSAWDWHGKIFRSGGIAEYPSISLSVRDLANKKKPKNSKFEVQLSDKPSDKNILISFTEKIDSDTLIFLAPYPLKENAKDFETASQMVNRQARWANEAINGKPIKLNKFEVITNIWGMKSPSLKEKSTFSLQSLGFNLIANADRQSLQKYRLKTYRKTWLYHPAPDVVSKRWQQDANRIRKSLETEEGKELFNTVGFWEISDEVSVLNFKSIEKTRLNSWFKDYLIKKGYELKNQGTVEYPLKEILTEELPQNVSLEKRKLYYHAAKFGQWWSAKQLSQINNLIQEIQPGVNTSTLLPSHGFLGNAWGPSKIGMSYGMLDIFELVKQKSVKQLAVEDWMGLNHMYGPDYTWTGGQTFGFYNALVRSAIDSEPMKIQGLITPSDDKYLRLKAHSSLGQGAKSFYFWSFGPTYVSTENYWSDLKSQYFGLAKLNRSLQKAEDTLYEAKTVSDEDVGILYSVSHDIWNNKNQSAFVEKRLLWHALRHLHIQPNFLREDDIEEGKLEKYKVLFITDWNITRKASEKIDEWVKNGGTLYLSAGAATRDEFNEPFTPNFAKKIWVENPTSKLTNQNSTFNERTVLPKIKPLTTNKIQIDNQTFDLHAIGTRLNLKSNLNSFAKFTDGKNAGAIISYGKGKIIAVGFMPMLAYGKLANFKPKTLEEKWQPEPRKIIEKTLKLSNINPIIKSDTPVVETNLLSGSQGSAIVLANYTYQPIKSLKLDVKIDKPVKNAISVEGKRVKILKQSKGVLSLELPLDWTDIILLK